MLGRIQSYVYDRLQVYLQRAFDFYIGGGVSTAGIARTEVDTYATGSDNWPYLGCEWPALRFALTGLGYGGTFVDLGSGKGKALLIAARLPYRRVVGVEIDEELAVAAQRNIELARRRHRAELVECVEASAKDWQIPDDASVIFMFNPFFGQTFYDTMRNVFDSYDRNPRELHFVYQMPWEHEWLLSTKRVVVENVRPEAWPPPPGWWTTEKVTVVYHVTGASQAPGPCRIQAHRLSGSRQRARQRWVASAEHHFSVPSLNPSQFLVPETQTNGPRHADPAP